MKNKKVDQLLDSILEEIDDKTKLLEVQDQYAVVWMDGIHYKIRHEGKVISKAAMIILGVDMDRKQDILSIKVVETKSASAWMSMLKNMSMRGVEDNRLG